MKIKFKCNKATALKIAGIALTIIGGMIETEERKIEIDKAVQLYLEDKSKNDVIQIQQKVHSL